MIHRSPRNELGNGAAGDDMVSDCAGCVESGTNHARLMRPGPGRSVWVKSGYQRRIHHLLNRGETRNSLARNVFHGHRGQPRKNYQVGQENQLDTLGIMILPQT